jgi:DNA-binding MarR family transcriptional regulator
MDDVVHQRARLGILAVLDEARRVDFNYLAATLDLTNGNLSRHLRVLEEAGLVNVDKRIEARRPRTWLSLTANGRKALHAEVRLLRAVVDRIEIPRG